MAHFKNLRGNTCGHFRQDQLKVYYYGKSGRAGSWFSFLFAGLLLMFSPRQTSAQATPGQRVEQYQPDIRENLKRAKRLTVPVTGTVTLRENGQVIPGVKVVLEGSSRETSTGADGKFRLDLANKDSTQLIVFSHPGFNTVQYIHNTARPGQEIAVEMDRHNWDNSHLLLTGKMGGLVVRRWYWPGQIVRDAWRWLTGR
jgi:hypothetical protein